MNAVAPSLLANEASLGEDVEVPDDLPDGENRLRLRHLAPPHPPSDVERRRAAAVDERGDLPETLLVEIEPVGDQPPMIPDHGAVAGEQQLERQLRRLPERIQVLDERSSSTFLRRTGRSDLGARGDLRQQVVADERDAVRLVDEERVRGAVPGPLDDAEESTACPDHVAVGENARA